jgi:ligand-binding sensor domain-containing protein
LCLDNKGQIWVGTQTMGVYVLNEDATSIVAQYTTDNSALPSNSILSIACDERGIVSIGTGEGLVQYNPSNHTLNTNWEEGDQEELDKGTMQQWRLHLSYANPQEIAATPQHIYAMANGSLFGVDRNTDELVYYNKATGLNGTDISHIAYDQLSKKLIIAYSNGLIDLLDNNSNVTQIPDISIKAGSIPVTIHCITVGSKYTYLGMPFGIIAINPTKAEVTDTYYIGDEASSIDIQQIVELGDSIYAFSYDRMYTAALHDNLIDYRIWRESTLPCEKVQQAVGCNNQLYTLQHDSLYMYEKGNWQLVAPNKLEWIHVSNEQLLTFQRGQGLLYLTGSNQLQPINSTYIATDGIYSNGEYWIAEEEKGLVRLGTAGEDFFRPIGPANNSGYQLDIAHNQLYIAHGGRWAEAFGRQCNLSIYDGLNWRIIPFSDTWYYTEHDIRDVVKYAIDPQDPGHFFVATYGTGVFEFKDYRAIQHYDNSNSSLQKNNTNVDHYYYTRTDGATIDTEGNLWVLNATTIGKPLHVRTKNGRWVGLNIYNNGQAIHLTTPGPIWIDQRNAEYKWIIDQREEPGIILFHDNGTPTDSIDDRAIKRNLFIDQDGKTIQPANIMCLTQDLDNRIWVGTQTGLFIIPTGIDFYSSNSCKRIIIPRNDGTNLGDYLLGNEQINCIAADGGNRMWIGTANSGLYLIEDDTITVAHFTETNSLLPSNNILSIAIMPTTGEVFVGTAKGIASYRSNASAPKEDLSQAYAFPNPVRPNYGGAISIAGLMENTMVNIIDAGGNLVCKTRSYGGLAVWSGYLPDGTKAKSGVYTALCNEPNGASTVVKILVL